MESRVFALIIGIDVYLSGNIWNLHSCVDDAKKMKIWLTNVLHIPENHIRMLLDCNATKRAIEDAFMTHFVNNISIEPGDAILIYFAGHGSSLLAPSGWLSDNPKSTSPVQVLCPHDHDTLGREGRIAGISDRSLTALINDVCTVKGNNITLILDCSFSADKSTGRNRRHTRWTPTYKAQSDDLYSGLWQSARGSFYSKESDCPVFSNDTTTHVTLSACGLEENARENKQGGTFTTALLEAMQRVPLHRTSYDGLVETASSLMPHTQRPICVGKNKHQPFFDNIAFLPHPHFVELDYLDGHLYRLGVGSLSQLKKGSKFTVHLHNLGGSANPPIAMIQVQDVHPLWCLARSESRDQFIPQGCYARVSCRTWYQRCLDNLDAVATILLPCRRERSGKIALPLKY